MALSPAEILRALSREAQAVVRNELTRAFSRFSNALHVVTGTGFPAYTKGDPFRNDDSREPLFALAVSAANAVPATEGLGFDCQAFGAVRIHWRNTNGGTRTSLDFDVWAETRLGWVLLDGESKDDLAEKREVRIASAGYRRIYIRVSALNGGAGEATVYVGGEP
jgi:hypothetical protein